MKNSMIFLFVLILLAQTAWSQNGENKLKSEQSFELVNQPEMLNLIHVHDNKLRKPLIVSGASTFPVGQVLINLHLKNFMTEDHNKYFQYFHQYRFIESMLHTDNLSGEQLWARIAIKGDVSNHKNKSFLDIGAGTCGLVPWLCKNGASALGADLWYDPEIKIPNEKYSHGQNKFMELFRKLHKAKLTLDCNMGDATQLKGIENQSYDFVVSHMLFGDLSDESQEKMIEHAWRVCKVGGTIRIATDISYLEEEGKSIFKKRILEQIENAAKKYPGKFEATILGLDTYSNRNFRRGIDDDWYRAYQEHRPTNFEPVQKAIDQLKKEHEVAYYLDAFPEVEFLKAAFTADRDIKGAFTFTVDLHAVLIVINKVAH